MPGHTPGHTVLQLELKDETVLLSGDLYHFNAQRRYRRIPRFNTNVDSTLASFDKFEELVSRLEARVIIQHEPDDYAALPKFPEVWE